MPSVMNGLAFNDLSTSRSCQSDTCKLSGTCWRSSVYRSTSTALRATAVMCSHLEPCGGKYKLKAHRSGVQLRGLHTVKQSTVVRSLLPPVGDGGSTFGSGNFVDRINDEDYPQYQPQPKPLLNTVQETVAGRLKAEHVPHLMDHVKETCDLTGAAKLVILVNRGQFMTDNLDQVTLGSMLYCLVIRLPESEVWTPVFFGESGVGNRLMRQYMEGNRYFAEYEPNHRRFSMMEILSKPLDIAVQFIEVDKAIRSMCKKLVLQRFDFAFNDKQNGSVRDNPLLQQVSHLPDTNPYMRRELEREKQQLASRRGARSRATNVQQDRSSLTGSRRRQFSSVASATSERLIGKGAPDLEDSQGIVVGTFSLVPQAAYSQPQYLDGDVTMNSCDVVQLHFNPTSWVQLFDLKPVVVVQNGAVDSLPKLKTRVTFEVDALVWAQRGSLLQAPQQQQQQQQQSPQQTQATTRQQAQSPISPWDA